MSQSTILLATSNPHKVQEVRAILEPLGLHVLSLADVPGGAEIPEPVEDADTFEGNARIKALHYAQATGRICLADDSGLEVDALDGAPGVLSARYAGLGDDREMRDGANNEKLLHELRNTPDEQRTARFVCAMCAAHPTEGVIAIARGHFEGSIAREPRGSNGFGYDPLLLIDDGRTSAELSPEEKNARSHRGAAARAIAPRLKTLLTRAR